MNTFTAFLSIQSKALTLQGGHDAEETVCFLLMISKVFDCINVHNFTHDEICALKHPSWVVDVERLKV